MLVEACRQEQRTENEIEVEKSQENRENEENEKNRENSAVEVSLGDFTGGSLNHHYGLNSNGVLPALCRFVPKYSQESSKIREILPIFVKFCEFSAKEEKFQ